VSNHRLRHFIARWELPFAVATVLLYACAIPFVFILFPDISNLWVSLLVLFSGFTASLTALASLLKEREP
jgi:hypothetical protein